MLDLLDMIAFIERVLRESTDSVRIRQLLREEHRRLSEVFVALENAMEKTK